jgi:Na+/H+ antiporter NhaD/arsenite permease-like protein
VTGLEVVSMLAKLLPAPLLTLLWSNAALASEAAHGGDGGHDAAQSLADVLAIWHVIPFAGLLLCIAILPMVAHHWFEKNKNQLLVAVLWAVPILGLLGYHIVTHSPFAHDAEHGLKHAVEEYISFIALLGSLFVISGGIYMKGDLEGKPIVNTTFLLVGAIIANVIGTTGASMLLIRPMLRTNRQREYVKHIPLFFIFLVSNIGGGLTPIGDPPLFLGYLRGVPFFWTLTELWHIWLVPIVILVALFFVVDTYFYRKENTAHIQDDRGHVEPIGFEGKVNFLLLGGVIASVLLLSPEQGVDDFRHYYAREIAMAALTIISVYVTSKAVREKNSFTYGPILEVAALFLGIFITMIPATLLLQANGAALGVTEPWQYFWATGTLSSFLDNAPTYVTFGAMACGSVGAEVCPSAEQLGTLTGPEGMALLAAISCGAVFMGANSYIGNGPNFMVRAIAEENGYKMPSFFGYMGWAALVLLPVFALVTLLFFMG